MFPDSLPATQSAFVFESLVTNYPYPSGYIFPALIAALVPFRTYIVSRMFDEDDLVILDPMDESITPPDSQRHNDVENQTNKGSQSEEPVNDISDERSCTQHCDSCKTSVEGTN